MQSYHLEQGSRCIHPVIKLIMSCIVITLAVILRLIVNNLAAVSMTIRFKFFLITYLEYKVRLGGQNKAHLFQ